MNTLGNLTKGKVLKSQMTKVNHSFIAASDLKEGQLVKLSTGGVDKIAAKTEKVFGLVVVPAKAGFPATIATPFNFIIKSKLGGTVVAGQEVSVSSFDGSDDIYAPSVANDVVSGIALEAGVSGEEVEIGLLTSYIK